MYFIFKSYFPQDKYYNQRVSHDVIIMTDERQYFNNVPSLQKFVDSTKHVIRIRHIILHIEKSDGHVRHVYFTTTYTYSGDKIIFATLDVLPVLSHCIIIIFFPE